MHPQDKLFPISDDHPDAAVVTKFRQLLTGLWMYSEAQEPYSVFLWEVERFGELLEWQGNIPIFSFMRVVERLHGAKIPIRRTNLLQAKQRSFFIFEKGKLKSKKPKTFYRDRYAALNRFMGRIYTDNGALNPTEVERMRAFADEAWALEPNSVFVFEFGTPMIHQYLMGKTKNGNWLGVYTSSVET